MSGPDPEVVKWYTRARKFPQLIGRTPDGAKIWGGPYTFTQAVGAGAVLFAGVNTMRWWASYGLIGNAMILLGVAYGTVLALGRIPLGSRNPVAVTSGALHALTAPRTGRLAGRAVRLRRPHRVRHSITVLLTDPPPPVRAPAPAGAVPAGRRHLRRGPAPAAPATRRRPAAGPQPAPPAQATPPSRPPAAARPALSGVQLLLAQTDTKPERP